MYTYKKYFYLLISLILGLSSFVFASNKTGAAFLKIGIGARPIGMGEAFVAVSDDANSLYWNPAGLSQIKKREVTAMYNQWFCDIQHLFAGYVSPIAKQGTFGLSLNYLNYGNITKTIETDAGLYAGEDGSFNAYDLAGAVAYSQKLTDSIFVGASIKYIQQKNESESATGIAFDVGCLLKLTKMPINNSKIGLVVQNIGPRMEFIEESFCLPITVKVGASCQPLKNLMAAMDISQRDITLGGEYKIANILALRTGYKFKYMDNKLGAIAGLRIGAGFGTELFKIDYAYAPYGDLGNTHRVSLTAKFDLPQKRIKPTYIEVPVPTPAPKKVEKEKNICPVCGAENPSGSSFCNECGSKLEVEIICPNCGYSNPPGSKFCNECGTKLNDTQKPEEEIKEEPVEE